MDVFGPSVVGKSLHPNLVVEIEQFFISEPLFSVETTELIKELHSNVALYLSSKSRALNFTAGLQTHRRVLGLHDATL